MTNIVIPMVGRGTRVQDAYQLPKPLIELHGKTIIERAVSSLGIPGRYIFIVREFLEYGDNKGGALTLKLINVLRSLKPDCEIVLTSKVTEGPASSVLLAKHLIDSDEELIVTNCDQMTVWNPLEFLEYSRNFDGSVTTYPHEGIILNEKSPYSFIKLNEAGFATEFKEKYAISYDALNGIHYWRRGQDFVAAAEQMIEENDRVNNEFYVSTSYNQLIKLGKKIVAYPMEKGQFYALGSTSEILEYLKR